MWHQIRMLELVLAAFQEREQKRNKKQTNKQNKSKQKQVSEIDISEQGV